MNKIFHVALIGIGGTITMDLWALLLKALGVKGLNFAFLGRWVLYMFQAKWFHAGIANSPAMPGELYVGWFTHYLIGITFCLLLVSVYGLKWVDKPSLKPALIIGLITVMAPLLILQPAFGLSYSLFSIIKSFVTHTVYGIGLYFTAVGIKKGRSFISG